MPWSREDIQRLIELESHQRGIDPRLGLALAEQESGFDQKARSPKGAIGIFQLMPKTAQGLKVDPTDVAQNISGGLDYLKQQLDAFGGDPAKAIAAYNAGPGVVQAYKGVPPYKETRGLVSRVLGSLGPASADAATPQAQPQPQTAGMSRLQELEAHLAQLEGRAAQPAQATAPSPPTATSTPEQDAAYRASRGQQEGATAPQPPSPTIAQPGGSQRPSGARLSLGDPTEAASEAEARATIEQMRQRQAQPSPGDLSALAVGGGPSQQAPTVTDPAALLAVGGGQTREQQILAEARARQLRGETQAGPLPPGMPTIEHETLQEGITKPSTMIPLLMPGAGARAGMRILPEAWRWVGRIGGEAVTQTAAELGGRAIETGKAPNWQEIATTTAWNLAPQAGEELLRAVPRAVLRSGQGARTILSDVAAQESKGLGRRVFHPQDEQVLSKMFEDVKASGVKLDIDPVTDLFTSLKPEQRQVLLRDVKTISSPLAAALQRTGTPAAPRLTGWDIGDLQTLRSELIKRGHAVRTPERQDLINEMRMAVDDAISNGMAVGSTAAGGNPEMLKAAQAGWRRLKQSDDLQALVTKHTNYSPNLQYQDLNLAALRKSLDGTNPLGRKVAASLGETETAALQHELAILAKRYPFVKVPNSIMNIGGKVGLPGAAYLAITGNLPGAAVAASSAVMALALQSPRAMGVFRSAIVNGKGRLSTNDIAAIVNAARQVSDVEEPASGTPQ